MMNSKHHFHHGVTGSAITVRVTPRSSRNEISEILSDGTVKIRLTAPPVEGQANAALVKFLADVLQIPPTKIEIIAGLGAKDKLVTILDLDTQTVQERILAHLS